MPGENKITVLVVDDSLTARELLTHVINADPELEVIGAAADGVEALRMVKQYHPDVVTMDIHMPGMNGFETTRKIMEECPVPIVVITASREPSWVSHSFNAVKAGALTILEKPLSPEHPESRPVVEKILESLKVLSQVKVVRRFPQKPTVRVGPTLSSRALSHLKTATPIEIVAVGASTGGPAVIRSILAGLRPEFPLPVLVAQHMSSGFIEGMVVWLQNELSFPVTIPENRERLLGGRVYFAPDGLHLGVGRNKEVILSDAPPENGLRPSVSYLFRSVASAYGPRAAGVLLTGMGRDGSAELKEMRDRGAITIAQNKDTAAVFGMPGEAVKLGAAEHVLSPEKIAALLNAAAWKSSK